MFKFAVSQLLIAAAVLSLALADISLYSPPFLRTAGQQKSPQSSFTYLGPPSIQQQPQASLIRDNAVYNSIDTSEYNDIGNSLLGGNVGNLNALSPDLEKKIDYNKNFEENQPFSPLTHVDLNPRINLPNSLDKDIEAIPVHNNKNNEGLRPLTELSGNYDNSHRGDVSSNVANNANTMPRVARPQLRQLDLETSRGNNEQQARKNQKNGKRGRANRVSEGHRLITRALWRIFDALMEKNEKEELSGRMNFVENAIKDLITSGSKLEGLIEMIKVRYFL